ncbi:FAD dependent oxidoreductase [Popillia japonica]|uniref:FAD dependent oxidoreductase n=1 Tax=Popillia japonica TaxID=7064 RepID=A0AAW1JV86_POPJA
MKCRVAVIGAGVVGLCSAVRIQDSLGDELEIVIYTADKSPNTTGDVSAGYWAPYLIQNTPTEKIIQWSKETLNYFLELWRNGLASECGISLQPVTCLTKEYTELPSWSPAAMGCQKLSEDLVRKYSKLHQRPYISGYHFVSVTCEPSKLLPYLEKKFVSRGGKIIMKKIESFSQLNEYDLIINCTGISSKYLNSDEKVKPIRGQIARVVAPWQFDIQMDDSDDGHYIIPNQDSVILGGTHQINNWNVNPTSVDMKFILDGCAQLVPALKGVKIIKHQAGLRPGRDSIKLELETKNVDGKIMHIIHNYGHGGCGVTLCYGSGGEVAELARVALKNSRKMVEKVSPSQQTENLNAIFEAMKQMTQELKKDIEEMRQQNKHDIQELRKNIEEGNQRMNEKIWTNQKQMREELADFKEKTQTAVEVQKELADTKREFEQRIKGIENATPISVERIVEERKLPIYDASNKGIERQEFFEALKRYFKIRAMPEDRKLDFAIIERQEFFEALKRYFKIRAMPEDRKLDFAIDQLKDDVAIWAAKRNQWTTTVPPLDQDILKFRWERMQHEHKKKRLQDEADKEFEGWLGKLTEIQPVTSIKESLGGYIT